MQNKTTKVILKGKEVTLVYLKSTKLPELKKITSAAVIPFLPDGKIVATLLDRGLDIPGGHQEKGDKSLMDILQRESMEEAGIILKNNLKILQVIASDYYPYESYMVIVAGFVDRMITNFKPEHESKGRKIVTVEEFIEKYDTVMKKEIVEIVLKAKKVLFQKK